jgi:Rrf2 family protein
MVYSRTPLWSTAQHESIAYPAQHYISLELGKNGSMHITAKADYGMRALLELTSVYLEEPSTLVKAETISEAQDIPAKFLEGILRQLRQTGIVASKRGAAGGYRLNQSPAEITIADVVRALDGPLAAVRGQRPEDVEYAGPTEHLKEVWVAVRAAMRDVLEHITLADVAANKLPDPVTRLLDEPGAWQRRTP